MRIQSNKLVYLLTILFFSSINLEINSHNILNGGCENHCDKEILQKNFLKRQNKNEIYLEIESNSCLNNSLCRG